PFSAGVGKSCLLLRFSDGSFTTSFITTIGWVFKCFCGNPLLFSSVAAYYRGAMGILLVYDVTDESSFNSNHLTHILFFCSLSAKTNLNVEQVFFSIARDIKQRLAETDSKPEVRILCVCGANPVFYVWSLISWFGCRIEQSRLTNQTRQLLRVLQHRDQRVVGLSDQGGCDE
ncbi:hypothetical protein BHE74_00020136, partial [Ensete ventricosum]